MRRSTPVRCRWGAGAFLAALICAVLVGSGFDPTASAQTPATDYDADDDGLIEVASEAQLNAIRWDLDGSGVVEAAANATTYAAAFPTPAAMMGCPAAACTGYELAADLDFDTDGSGKTSEAGDTYWNIGVGWEPIGDGTTNFTATFDGNGHTIRNLFINRTTDNIGLFGVTGTGSVIRNVKLTGVNVIGRRRRRGAGRSQQGPD